jgi:hypothetical protein
MVTEVDARAKELYIISRLAIDELIMAVSRATVKVGMKPPGPITDSFMEGLVGKGLIIPISTEKETSDA